MSVEPMEPHGTDAETWCCVPLNCAPRGGRWFGSNLHAGAYRMLRGPVHVHLDVHGQWSAVGRWTHGVITAGRALAKTRHAARHFMT